MPVTHNVLVDVGAVNEAEILVPGFVELGGDDVSINGDTAKVGEARETKSVVLGFVSGSMETSVTVVVLVTGGSLAGSVVVVYIVRICAAWKERSAVGEGADVD